MESNKAEYRDVDPSPAREALRGRVLDVDAPYETSAQMKVLHIFPSFEIGGQQSRFAMLAAALGGGFQHHVISLNGNLSAKALINVKDEVTYQPLALAKPSWPSLDNFFKLRAVIKEARPGLLCTYNWGAMEAVAANRFGLGVAHIHFEDGFANGAAFQTDPLRRRLTRALLLQKSRVIVPSDALYRYAQEAWSLKEPGISLIRNGVDLDRFHPATERKASPLRVASVGALRPEKNHVRLIRAFLKADPGKNAHLLIIGDGPEHDTLATLIDLLRATERVTLTGAKDDIHKVYQQIDIFALSSDTEQAPLSLIEAMASGLPVVSTAVGDIPQMIAHENSAYITEPENDEALSLALAKLLQNAEAREAIGAANRRKAERAYDLETMVDAHRTLYLTVAARDD